MLWQKPIKFVTRLEKDFSKRTSAAPPSNWPIWERAAVNLFFRCA